MLIPGMVSPFLFSPDNIVVQSGVSLWMSTVVAMLEYVSPWPLACEGSSLSPRHATKFCSRAEFLLLTASSVASISGLFVFSFEDFTSSLKMRSFTDKHISSPAEVVSCDWNAVLVQHSASRHHSGGKRNSLGLIIVAFKTAGRKKKSERKKATPSALTETIVAQEAFLYEGYKNEHTGRVATCHCPVRNGTKGVLVLMLELTLETALPVPLLGSLPSRLYVIPVLAIKIGGGCSLSRYCLVLGLPQAGSRASIYVTHVEFVIVNLHSTNCDESDVCLIKLE